jgi:hypothetical protein
MQGGPEIRPLPQGAAVLSADGRSRRRARVGAGLVFVRVLVAAGCGVVRCRVIGQRPGEHAGNRLVHVGLGGDDGGDAARREALPESALSRRRSADRCPAAPAQGRRRSREVSSLEFDQRAAATTTWSAISTIQNLRHWPAAGDLLAILTGDGDFHETDAFDRG